MGLTTGQLVGGLAGLAVLGTSIAILAGVFDDVTEHDGLASGDPTHLHYFIQHRTPQLVQDSRWMSQLGGIAVLAVLALLVAGLLWFRGARLVLALAPGLALGAAGTCAAVGKQLVGRARPPAALRLATETEASFPSGHATDSTAFYVTVALVVAVVVLRRPLARAATIVGAALLATAIGTSRLVLGVHWPTDVVAGWALGLTVGVGVTLAAIFLSRFLHLGDAPPLSRAARILYRLSRTLLLARPPRTSHASGL